MLGNASLALEDLPSECPARTAIQCVVEAAERAAQLAQQMLAYSGKGHFVLEHLDLSARVQQTLPLIRAAIPANVAVHLDLDKELPLIVADVAQIQQLDHESHHQRRRGDSRRKGRQGYDFHSPADGRRPVCAQADGTTGELHLQQGLYAMLEVSDTGSGMDSETKARIFDPFFTTKFTGRGLGLAAVLGIVRGHRGSIEVLRVPLRSLGGASW